MSAAALLAAFLLWRSMRRIQVALKERKSPAPSVVRAPFDSVELSLEAMLEELEERSREVLRKIERREEELSRLFAHGDTLYRRLAQEPLSQGRAAVVGTAPTGGATPAGPAEGPSGEPKPASAPPESKSEAVRRLAKEGMGVLEIAKHLGIGKGEVQLILDLTD